MSARAVRRVDNLASPWPLPGNEEARCGGLTVTIHRMRKSFGRTEVLRCIDLRIRAGEFVAVVGRSGCGKSTLLRLLLGLERPSGGYFRFGDEAVKPAPAGAIRIMFQEPRLLPWASVLANVEIGLGAERSSRNARERALAALRDVGLENRRDHWPSVLSGGQKQRVALARALVSRPRVLAFDEPLGALDALTRISMQQLIERVWIEQRFTAIMVTHDVAEAVTLADRVLMIEAGEITLDQRIDLPRPRERGSPALAALEGQILGELLRDSDSGEKTASSH